MRNLILLLAALSALGAAQGQRVSRFSFATTLGTCITLSEPASTPLLWQVEGYYNFNSRFAAGAGTGLSFYEKTLVPIFAGLKFHLIRPRRFTPYVECNAGYAFAPGRETAGGFLFAPSIGVRYAVGERWNLLFSLGYELQKLQRLRRAVNPCFTAEFQERLRHHGLSLRIGVLF